jgi:hypothetical protein
MNVCVRNALALPLVVSPEPVEGSNHEQNGSSFDRLRTSVCAKRLTHFMRQQQP